MFRLALGRPEQEGLRLAASVCDGQSPPLLPQS